MDPSSLSPLLPLGGGFFLLVYLITTLINDRIVLRREMRNKEVALVAAHVEWNEERKRMRLECRQEIADAKADMLEQTKFQRDRIAELEQEVMSLRHGEGGP